MCIQQTNSIEIAYFLNILNISMHKFFSFNGRVGTRAESRAANRRDPRNHWRSPFTKNSIYYVLATTQDNLDEWVSVKANVKEHFKKLHNLEVNELNGVAIMTDTDNSKLKAISYYQNIYFSSE